MYFDLNLIQRFEAVYRHQSFSFAAKELGMTHSALTKSIQALEEAWGVKLFERTTRKVQPTESGRRLAALGPDLLSQAALMKNNVIAGNQKLRIICGAAILENYISSAISKFAQNCPEVYLDIEAMPADIASELLLNQRADIIIFNKLTIEGLPLRHEFELETIIDEPYYMVYRFGHPVGQVANNLDDVLKFDWVVAGFGGQYQTRLPKSLIAQFAKFGFPKHRIMNQGLCLEMVLEGDFITLVPQSFANSLTKSGKFGARPFPSNARVNISAATLRGSIKSHNVAAFLKALKP